MVLALDESGEKQYSNKPESEQDGLGVMAGILLTDKDMSQLSNICKELFSDYHCVGKRHITELDKKQQEQLRYDVVTLFKVNRIRWFYEAIHSQGFYDNFNTENRLGYKTYGEKKKHLLHAKLFRGVLNKSIDLLAQGGRSPVYIKIITDRIDKPILNKFNQEAEDLLITWLGGEKSITVRSYDIARKKVIEKQLKSWIKIEGFCPFENLDYEIVCENSEITFLADILANMTYYYLRKAQKHYPGSKLNSKAAILGHPLIDLVITCGPEEQFTDRLYKRNET